MIVSAAVLTGGGLAHAESPPPRSLSTLQAEFQAETSFWKQHELAREIAELGDPRVLAGLEPWLEHEDRHLRANAAYLFARLGDPRGFETLVAILGDFSDRALGQGLHGASPCGVGAHCDPETERQRQSEAQIASDRYYAVHLLGELGDPQAIDDLVPLLGDPSIGHKVAWALGEIGDPRATEPLIQALRDPEALVRTAAIHALEKLRAVEALPSLRELLDDSAIPRAGERVPVAETARRAIETLEGEP